jgi:hypothetical protein
MPTIPHIEKHFTATEIVRDVFIGIADSLTVPFPLAARCVEPIRHWVGLNSQRR